MDADVERDGIVRHSGQVRATIRYRGYRAPGRSIGAGIRVATLQLVLTRRSFFILGRRTPRIPLDELGRYRVAAVDGKLVIASDAPSGASGHVEFSVRVEGVDDWVAALRSAGAAS